MMQVFSINTCTDGGNKRLHELLLFSSVSLKTNKVRIYQSTGLKQDAPQKQVKK
jgi:hypothetical protein